jgi:glycosyltransferase involved in cell wall biosynthesis
MPELSIIIPCFNAAGTLGDQLLALADQAWEGSWEVIIADNGSTDDTLQTVGRCSGRLPELRVVGCGEKQGRSFARNRGAEAARSQALVFIDADDVVAPGWLAAMGQALREHDFVAGRRDYERLNDVWVRNSFAEAEGIEQHAYLPFAPSCNLGIRRHLHDAVDGYDEGMLAVEDLDYCWKIQEKTGANLWYVPQAVVHFRLRRTYKAMFLRAWHEATFEMALYQKHREHGMPAPCSWRTFAWFLRDVARDVVSLRLASREARGRMLVRLGWRCGQLNGLVKFFGIRRGAAVLGICSHRGESSTKP